MSIRDFVAGELVDIIEWLDDSRDTMVWRFPRPNNEIKNGAQLIVRPGQLALLVDQGHIADMFSPGRHQLTTANLPVLSKLRGWKYGFESPFKVEVIFVNTTQFTNRKWGTSNPVIVRDPSLGPIRVRAFGTFAIRVEDPPTLVRELAGTNSLFTVDLINDQLRDLVVTELGAALTEGAISIFDLAAKYADLGERMLDRVAPRFTQYGLELTQLVVENVSLPPEVESALDAKAKMGMLGNLDQYAKLQSADALRDAARNPSGGAAAGVGIGMGAAMAQSAMSSKPATSTNEPPPIPQATWYYVVNGERRGPTDMSGLKQAVARGELAASTLVWKSGMAEWAAAESVGDVKAVLGA